MPPEVQKRLEKEKPNKPDKTVDNANKEKMDKEKNFYKKLNKLENTKTKYRAGTEDKSKMLDKLEQEQKQLGITVIKEKMDKTKVRENMGKGEEQKKERLGVGKNNMEKLKEVINERRKEQKKAGDMNKIIIKTVFR